MIRFTLTMRSSRKLVLGVDSCEADLYSCEDSSSYPDMPRKFTKELQPCFFHPPAPLKDPDGQNLEP